MLFRSDYGRVGVIEQVNAELLESLTYHGYVPVVSPVSDDEQGESLNVNADDAASALAQGLKADKLLLLSDVPGVLADASDPSTLISVIKTKEVEQLIAQGTITGGMVPKVRALRQAVENGVGKVHLIDGRVPHSLLMELFTDKGIGTLIEPGED